IIGFALTTDLIINYFGLVFRLIGDIIHFASLFLLFLFFETTPSFAEFEWKDKVESIYIMHRSGLLLYQKKINRNDQQEFYEASQSGVLTTLKMMLDNISDQQEATFIEKKGKFVLIQPGTYIYGVLICKKKLNSLISILLDIIQKIEGIYSGVLDNWDGNLVVFKPLSEIVKEFLY
ncbi:MAG: hypothetical protein JW891_07605, partial [Candidatus Lokiarchaeota archaeon]|nr:hypothetical protein [Candidatus Lokiarchaeota archaeon]